MQLIALTGPIGAGKSTAADYLIHQYGFTLLKFAHPLKRMLMAFGLTYEELEGAKKEIANPLLLGKTPRHAMQTLGTEWGRRLIGENLWTNAWLADIKRAEIDKIVVDDARFPNEFDLVKNLGGEIWSVLRKPTQPDYTHESEGHFRKLLPHKFINNNGTIWQLRRELDEAYREF